MLAGKCMRSRLLKNKVIIRVCVSVCAYACVCEREGGSVSSTKRLKANLVAFMFPRPARESASQSNHAACGCLVQLIARHPGFKAALTPQKQQGLFSRPHAHATGPPAGTSSHSTRVVAAGHGSSLARILLLAE